MSDDKEVVELIRAALSDRVEAAVKAVYHWRYDDTKCFDDLLIDLIRKADWENKGKLANAYPDLVWAVGAWQVADNHGDELFKRFGLFPKDP